MKFLFFQRCLVDIFWNLLLACGVCIVIFSFFSSIVHLLRPQIASNEEAHAWGAFRSDAIATALMPRLTCILKESIQVSWIKDSCEIFLLISQAGWSGQPSDRSPEPRPPFPRLSRLTSPPSHAKQWAATGSLAAIQNDNNGRAFTSQRMSIGLSFSVDSVAGATMAIPGGALSTWAPSPRPTSRQSWNLCSFAFIAARPSSNFE